MGRDKIVIIQARMQSTRLPGKVLCPIVEKPLLLHVIDRVKRASKVNHVIVATSCEDVDFAIVKCVEGYDSCVSVTQGSETNVLDRYYQSALWYNKLTGNVYDIVRITADCPLIDPDVIDLHLAEFDQQEVDYLSSRIVARTWPHGMELEVFSFEALEKAWQGATTQIEKEHVTPYIYATHKDEFSLYEFSYSADMSHYRFTVDYPEDMAFVKAIYEGLYGKNKNFSFEDIINFLGENPEIVLLNNNRVDTKIL